MSDLDLKAIKERCEAATGGEWHPGDDDYTIISVIDGVQYVICERVDRGDADFIAHAREDVPALVAEIERLRDELRRSAIHIRTTSELNPPRPWDHFRSVEMGKVVSMCKRMRVEFAYVSMVDIADMLAAADIGIEAAEARAMRGGMKTERETQANHPEKPDSSS